MIEVERVRKVFGEVTAVEDVSFSAAPGAIFGLLGPNGAGKTTTINCMCGLLAPTAGRIRIAGHDIARDGRQARAALGVVPQEIAVYLELGVRDNLSYWGAAQGLRNPELKARVADVMGLIGLADRAKEYAKNLSGGMKRRLNFGCGIIHRPRVLLLDEPTVGVDPQSRVRLLELVREQARAGATVLYTTHYMEEAENLCDRLAIIDHGRIIAQGTLAELRAILGERDLVRLTGVFTPAAARLTFDSAEIVQATADSLSLAVTNAAARLPALFAAVAETGSEIRGTSVTQPSLESLFIKLTGSELRE
jgi:ABC-2 type transport system ATP-binding protein